MTDIKNILLSYQKRGVTLFLKDGKLKFTAPAGELTDSDKAELKAVRDEIEEYLKNNTESQIISDEKNRYEKFGLTDIQSAYLVGQDKSFRYGGTDCKIYSEFLLGDIDEEKFVKAWHTVIKNNDMLHAVIEHDNTQRILSEYELPEVPVTDVTGSEQAELEIRERLMKKTYDPAVWPLYDLELSITEKGYIMHISLDMLIADFVSINLIFDQIEQCYYGDSPCFTDLSFRDVLIYRENLKKTPAGKAKYEEDHAYWDERVGTMPKGPDLPTIDTNEVMIKQYNYLMPKEKYSNITDEAKNNRLTVSNIILTAYAETLKYFSGSKKFCINLTMSDRPDIHPDINKIIGDFTIVDILEIKDSEHKTYMESAAEIQQTLMDDLDHKTVTGVEVLRKMTKSKKENVIIPVVFTSTLGADSQNAKYKRRSKLIYKISRTPQVIIDCQILEDAGELIINWDVREDAFHENWAESAFGYFIGLIESFVEHGGIKRNITHELPDQMRKVRDAANATGQKIATSPLYTGFADSLRYHPDNIALVTGGKWYTYRELGYYVKAVQDSLGDIEKGCIVGIRLKKSVWQTAAVLAVIMSGGTYLPLDSKQPAERAIKIMNNAGCRIMIGCEEEFSTAERRVINVDELSPVHDGIFYVTEVDQDSVAYIIYTSGSTGEPKGVAISHRGASNTILDINSRYGVNENDRFIGLANLAFDLSVYDIFGAFYAAAALVLVDDSKIRDPEHYYELIKNEGITIWNSVPAQMNMLTLYMEGKKAEPLRSMRLIMLSGDWIPVDLPKSMRKAFPSGCQISLGGATEASIWSIAYEIDPTKDYKKSIPYGKPLANQSFYCLDEQLEEVPDYKQGELYIGGDGVAVCYFNDEVLTEQKFIYHEKTGKRLYKTGDFGMYHSDGNIEFLGRKDFQVKIRGHRVELGEIENAVREVSCAELVKVTALKLDIGNVVACFLKLGEGRTADKEKLDSALLKKLPKYMIPSVYADIDELPMTQNGKVDTKELERIAVSALNTHKREVNTDEITDTMRIILDVWKKLFEISDISIDDDFFDLGGNSILIVKMVSDLAEHGISIDLAQVYESPTVRQISELIQEA